MVRRDVTNVNFHHYWFVETFAELSSMYYRESVGDKTGLKGTLQYWRNMGRPEKHRLVTVRGGCKACDPGVCPACGHLFTGETITIDHASELRSGLMK